MRVAACWDLPALQGPVRAGKGRQGSQAPPPHSLRVTGQNAPGLLSQPGPQIHLRRAGERQAAFHSLFILLCLLGTNWVAGGVLAGGGGGQCKQTRPHPQIQEMQTDTLNQVDWKQ